MKGFESFIIHDGKWFGKEFERGQVDIQMRISNFEWNKTITNETMNKFSNIVLNTTRKGSIE